MAKSKPKQPKPFEILKRGKGPKPPAKRNPATGRRPSNAASIA